ncbi:quinone oxidoreductase family protein [Vulgatibacter sp.]|uniref:quinone oxidoreductase family protein n=1 Tax=Vulgatibacter sp. TaxID=1971226 RepID=UPI003562C237
MKAAVVREFGGPEMLLVDEWPEPEAGPGEVVVQVHAAGVNFIDVYQRSGAYPGRLPRPLGLEGAGTVEVIGAGVEGFSPGDRVAWKDGPGSYAEKVAVAARELVPVPDGVGFETAAASMLQGMTAHYLSHSTFPLQGGQSCLVHAAAGGVGALLVQMAKKRGAFVYATCSAAKRHVAEGAGADHVIAYDEVDFAAEVKRLTGGAGVHVVYDSVGRATFDESLDCLMPRGTMVLFGQSSGAVPPLDLQVLNRKGSLYVTRPSLGSYTRDREELLWRAGDVLSWSAANELQIRIDDVLPLEEVAEAHRRLEGRKTMGKLVLRTV